MFEPGSVYYFKPFYFSQGGSKPKYFITIARTDDNLIIASLPSSVDHTPSFIEKRHGCLHVPEADFNAFLFEANRPLCTND